MTALFVTRFIAAGVVLGGGIWLLVKSRGDVDGDQKLLGSILTGIGIFMIIVLILGILKVIP